MIRLLTAIAGAVGLRVVFAICGLGHMNAWSEGVFLVGAALVVDLIAQRLDSGAPW